METSKEINCNGIVPDTSSTMLRALADDADSLRWTKFVDLYRPVLHFWLRRLKNGPLPSLSPDLFDDIIQETFVSLMKLFPRGGYHRECAHFRTLLQTILRRRAIDCLAERNSDVLRFLPQEELVSSSEDGSFPSLDGGDGGEEARQLRAEFIRLLIDSVFRDANFSGRSKAIFRRLAAGESIETLAAEYGLDRNAIYQLKNRIISRISSKAHALQRVSGDILDMICVLERQGEENGNG